MWIFEELFLNCFQLNPKIFPYFHQKNTVFWISSNFSQSVHAEYCGYDLDNPGTYKVDMGAPLPQFWCQYLKYFPRGVDLNIFFPEPRSWNKCVQKHFSESLETISFKILESFHIAYLDDKLTVFRFTPFLLFNKKSKLFFGKLRKGLRQNYVRTSGFFFLSVVLDFKLSCFPKIFLDTGATQTFSHLNIFKA